MNAMRDKLRYGLNGSAPGRWIAALAAASFWLRFQWARAFLATPYHEFTLHVNGPDQSRFRLWAEGIRAGQWAVPGAAPDAPFEFSPVYPWLLSLSMGFEKNPFLLIFALQAGLSCLAGLAIWDVGRRLGSGAAGVAGAVLWLFYAPSIFYDGCLIRESLLASTGLLAFWGALRTWERPSLFNGIAAGVLLGICTALRPHFFFAAAAGSFAVAAFRSADRRKFKLAAAAAILVAACTVIAPITARNLLVSGRWVPVSAQGADALILGNDPAGPGVSFVPTANSKAMLAASGGTLSGTLRTIAGEFRAKPRLMGELYARKLRMLVNAQEVRGNYSYYVWRRLIPPARWIPFDWAALFPLACLGGWFAFRRRNRWRWAAAGAAVFLAGAALVHIESRYRFAAVPFLALLGGYGLTVLGGMAFGRRPQPFRLAAALAAAAILALAVRPLPSFGYFQATGSDGVTRLNQDPLLPSDYTTLLTSWMLSDPRTHAADIRLTSGDAFRSYGPAALLETDASIRAMRKEPGRFLSRGYRLKYGLESRT